MHCDRDGALQDAKDLSHGTVSLERGPLTQTGTLTYELSFDDLRPFSPPGGIVKIPLAR